MNFIILDGGMGRELKRIGAPFQQPEWSARALIEDPKWVTKAHQNFIDAGAEVIITNSYACVPFHLGEDKFKKGGAQLIKLASQLARDVVDNSSSSSTCRVAGSIPPVLGSYRADLFSAKKATPILEAMVINQMDNIDVWILETISSLKEIRCINQVLDINDTKRLPRWLSLTLKDDADSLPTLRSGESLEDAVMLAVDSGVCAILFNCSIPEVMNSALKLTHKLIAESGKKIDLGVYPNAFTPIGYKHEANNQLHELRHISPQEYSEFAQQWLETGATIIGGCCGIGPEHIETLASLKKHAPR